MIICRQNHFVKINTSFYTWAINKNMNRITYFLFALQRYGHFSVPPNFCAKICDILCKFAHFSFKICCTA